MTPALPDAGWFRALRPSLLRLADSRAGRDFLGIASPLPVVGLSPNAVTYLVGVETAGGLAVAHKETHFRAAPVWANRLRARPTEFADLLRMLVGGYSLSPLALASRAVRATVTSFFPAADGQVNADNQSSWATCRTLATGTSLSTDALRVYSQHNGGGSPYDIGRSHVNFDTSSLSDGDTVSGAAFKATPSFKYAGAGGKTHVLEGLSASHTSIVEADYDAFNTTSYGSVLTSDTTVDAEFTVTLASGFYPLVNKTGYTKVCLVEDRDLNDSAPAASTTYGVKLYNTATAGDTQDPELVVTHASAAAPAGNAVFFGCAF